jgi:trimeric autotransporter adhesin
MTTKKVFCAIILSIFGLQTNCFSQSWSLTGNSSIDPLTNFIGTTDVNSPLIFKSHGYKAGELSSYYTSFGYRSGYSGTSVYVGALAGMYTIPFNSSLTPLSNNYYYNTYVGHQAGSGVSGGSSNGKYNSFFGSASGLVNTSGSHNVFSGAYSGQNNATGNNNVFLGSFAGSVNTVGSGNVFIGFQAGFNETGSDKLYVDNSNTVSPLIYGDFSANNLKFNGNVEVNGNSANASGLKFADLTSATTAVTANGKVLTVDAVGNVILVNDAVGAAGTTNTLTSSVNTMTSTVNGVVANAPIVNSVSNTITNGQLTTTVNGVVSDPVTLPSGGVDTDAQTLTLTGNQLAISNGNTVTLPSLTEVDGDVTNELQNLALTGNVLSISNGNSVTLPSFTDTDTDAQTLSVSGNQLTISNGNTVDLPVANGSETIIQAGTNVTVTGTGTAANPYIINSTATGGTPDINIYKDNGTLTGNRTVTMAGNNLIFNTSGNTTTTGGRIYIGNTTAFTAANFPTTTGDYRLNVEGGILTEKVKVALRSSANWADYVFADNYKLMPLKEVEAFVKENKHLPGVASAESLTKEGLDLGQMQAKQMEKIEELTLYVIEQNKTIEKQSKEIDELKAMVNALVNKTK